MHLWCQTCRHRGAQLRERARGRCPASMALRLWRRGTMILVKTEAGQQVLKDRSLRLTPRQRSAFILFDGKRIGRRRARCRHGHQLAKTSIRWSSSGCLGSRIGAAASAGPVDVAGRARICCRAAGAAGRSPLASADPRALQPAALQGRLSRSRRSSPAASDLRGFRLNLSVERHLELRGTARTSPEDPGGGGPGEGRALDAPDRRTRLGSRALL